MRLRHYEWSHQDHPQTKAFIRLLEEEYILKAKINDSDYGAFLIYTRRAGDEKPIRPISARTNIEVRYVQNV